MSVRRRAFTMVELLVILGILFLLFAMLVPAVAKVREAAARTVTVNNLKQIGLGFHNVASAYRVLPPACDEFGGVKEAAPVHVHILPFIEQDNLYRQLVKGTALKDIADMAILVYISPEDKSFNQDGGAGVQNHAANLRVFATKGWAAKFDENLPKLAAVEPGKTRLEATPDGTANTIWLATKFGKAGKEGGSRFASAPNSPTAAFFGQNAAIEGPGPKGEKAAFQLNPTAEDAIVSPLMAQSFNKNGISVGFMDGSVRFLSAKVDAKNWNCLLCPTDGNVVDIPDDVPAPRRGGGLFKVKIPEEVELKLKLEQEIREEQLKRDLKQDGGKEQ